MKNTSHNLFQQSAKSFKTESVFKFPPANDIVYYTAEDAYLLQLLHINQPDFIICIVEVDSNDLELSVLQAQL